MTMAEEDVEEIYIGDATGTINYEPYGMDVAPDGSVWLWADGALYVITPEAVVDTE